MKKNILLNTIAILMFSLPSLCFGEIVISSVNTENPQWNLNSKSSANNDSLLATSEFWSKSNAPKQFINVQGIKTGINISMVSNQGIQTELSGSYTLTQSNPPASFFNLRFHSVGEGYLKVKLNRESTWGFSGKMSFSNFQVGPEIYGASQISLSLLFEI